MSERNEAMTMLLAADAPAAHDLAFEIALMAKIEQRRFVRSMARNMAVAAVLAALLALLAPQLDWAAAVAGRWSLDLSPLTGNTLLMATLVLTGFAVWYFRPAEV